MRRAGHDSGWHLTPNGDVLGFSLLGDYCTEHEIGVRPLKEALGTPKNFENGLADRVNQRVPKEFRYEEYTYSDGQLAGQLLVASDYYRSQIEDGFKTKSHLSELVDFRPPFLSAGQDPQKAVDRSNFVGAWDEHGFLVHVRGEENVRRLELMARSFKNHDIAFGGKLVDRDADKAQTVGGLTFVRASQVDPVLAAQTLKEDQSEVRLHEAADKVLPKLKEDLRTAGKSWFAISPAWKDKDDESQGLIFWLNPQQQSDYNAGWFKEEKLRAWARNEGPIMKDKELEAADRANQALLKKLEKNMTKARIVCPWFHTIRSAANPKEFSIVVKYNQAIKPGWTGLPEGETTLEKIQAAIPAPPPPEPRATRGRKP